MLETNKVIRRHREMFYWIDRTGQLSIDDFIEQLFNNEDFLKLNTCGDEKIKDAVQNKNYPFADSFQPPFIYVVLRRRSDFDDTARKISGQELLALEGSISVIRRSVCLLCQGEFCKECNWEGYSYQPVQLVSDQTYNVIELKPYSFGLSPKLFRLVVVE